MKDTAGTRLVVTTAALATVAALCVGGANAMLIDADGGTAGSPVALSGPPTPIADVSRAIGLDAAPWSGGVSGQLADVHGALQRDGSRTLSGPEHITAAATVDDGVAWTVFGGAGLVAAIIVALAGVLLTRRRRRSGVAFP